MKLIFALLTLSVSASAMAQTSTALDCEQVAKDAATVFQNQIVKEIAVSETWVENKAAHPDSVNYSIGAINGNGTRMRFTTVETDDVCNVQSVTRE